MFSRLYLMIMTQNTETSVGITKLHNGQAADKRGRSLNIRRATAPTVCRPQHFKTPRISFTTLYLLLVFLQETSILACCNFEPIQHHQYGRLFFTGASMKRLQPKTPTTAFDVSVHDLSTDAIWSSLAWGMLPKKVLKRK